VLIHVSALNQSLVMRQWLGKGTPRGWQGFSADDLLSGLLPPRTVSPKTKTPQTQPE
jgi:hypothetical protein